MTQRNGSGESGDGDGGGGGGRKEKTILQAVEGLWPLDVKDLLRKTVWNGTTSSTNKHNPNPNPNPNPNTQR